MELQTLIEGIVNFALTDNTSLNSIISIGSVTKQQANDILNATGLDVAEFEYMIDKSGIKHTFKQHGNAITEAKRGQIAIVTDDFLQLPAIIANGMASYVGKNKIGRDVILFEAQLEYNYYYLQEVRTGRRQLAMLTLYKRKPPTK